MKVNMIELDAFLPYKLATLSHKMSESFAQVYAAKYDLTVPQWRIIAHLAKDNELTAKTICGRAIIDKSTASRAVKQLQERGLINGKHSDKDKRATVLSLTHQGNELYGKLSRDAMTWQENQLGDLSQEEVSYLLRLLNKLQQS